MLNIKHSFKKNKLNKESIEELMLIELEAQEIVKKSKISRKKLNICLCIDKSGSMNMSFSNISNGYAINNNNLFGNNNLFQNEKYLTKLEMVKEASFKAIDQMEDGDYISVVSFDNHIQVEVESVKLTSSNRTEIKNKVNNIRTLGATNIYDAWVKSVEEVSKNVSEDFLNRVILLTDGQINSGESNIDTISTNISKIADVSISTTAFGVGEGFNENLLQSISESGRGNFYFIDTNENLYNLFDEEFNGISNISATDIKLTIELENSETKESLNQLTKNNNEYRIADMRSLQKLPLLFTINTNNIKDSLKGGICLSFKNNEGKFEEIKQEINITCINKIRWEELEENKEIIIQHALFTVAQNKIKAMEEVNKGNRQAAMNIMGSSSSMLRKMSFDDVRIKNEDKTILGTVDNMDSASNSMLSKTLMYQSYKTRTGKV
jgi:Ca-activated chloride channel family protein